MRSVTLRDSKRRSSSLRLEALGALEAERLCAVEKLGGAGEGPLRESERSVLRLVVAETRGLSSRYSLALARPDARGAPEAIV